MEIKEIKFENSFNSSISSQSETYSNLNSDNLFLVEQSDTNSSSDEENEKDTLLDIYNSNKWKDVNEAEFSKIYSNWLPIFTEPSGFIWNSEPKKPIRLIQLFFVLLKSVVDYGCPANKCKIND